MRYKKEFLACLISFLLLLSFASAVFASKQEGKTLADLPPEAQMTMSEAIGRDNETYHATNAGGGYQFKPGQGPAAQFSGNGAVVSRWQLSLAGIGRGDELKTPLSAKPVAKANLVEYPRGDVLEWYINGLLGLEQGFTLAHAPETNRQRPAFPDANEGASWSAMNNGLPAIATSR